MNKKYILMIICMCGLAASSIGLCINAMGVFYTPVSSSLGVLRGTYSMTVTCSSLAMAFAGLVVTKILNKKNFKIIQIISYIVAIGSTVLMGCSTQIWQFYVLGMIRGIAVAFFGMVVLSQMINHWFIARHGLVTSIILSFSGIAGAFFSPVFSNIITKYGYQKGFFAMSISMAIFCLPATLFLNHMTPQEEGLQAYGYTGEITTSKKQNEHTKFKYPISFYLMIVFSFCCSGLMGLAQHLPSYAISIGASATTGAFMLSCCMVGNILSKLFIGALTDKFGAYKANITMFCLTIIAMIILIVAPNTFSFYIGSFLFGFIYAAAAVGTMLISKELFTVKYHGIVYPIISFSGTTGAAIFLFINGFIYDMFQSYLPCLILAIGIEIVMIILMTVARNLMLKHPLD